MRYLGSLDREKMCWRSQADFSDVMDGEASRISNHRPFMLLVQCLEVYPCIDNTVFFYISEASKFSRHGRRR